MANGSDRLDRIETILEGLAREQAGVVKILNEMAARQQYHDEALEQHDVRMKIITEAIAADAENIRALVRVAEFHHQRLENLEGGAV